MTEAGSFYYRLPGKDGIGPFWMVTAEGCPAYEGIGFGEGG